MFLLLPFIIWMFDTSVSSEISFARFSSAFGAGLGFVPGWFVKLVALALIWAYLHHFDCRRPPSLHGRHPLSYQGVRRSSAIVTLVLEHWPDRCPGRQALSGCTDLLKETQSCPSTTVPKRVVVGAHYGLRDWLAQRVTAVLMALFTVIVLAQVLFTKGPIGYDLWAGILPLNG
jgi:hypothetical protein